MVMYYEIGQATTGAPSAGGGGSGGGVGGPKPGRGGGNGPSTKPGGGGFISGSSTQWRVTFNPPQNNPSFAGLNQLYFLANEGDAATIPGGSYTASRAVDAGTFLDLFNGGADPGSFAGWNSGTAITVTATYATAKTVRAFKAKARNAGNYAAMPNAYLLEYYNGSTWVAETSGPMGALPAYASSQTREYVTANYQDVANGHRYWLIGINQVFSGTYATWNEFDLLQGSTSIIPSNVYLWTPNLTDFVGLVATFPGVAIPGTFAGNDTTGGAYYVGLDMGRKVRINKVRWKSRTDGAFGTQCPKGGTVKFSDSQMNNFAAATTFGTWLDAGATPGVGETRTTNIV
jgi:hypothetical protein